MINIHPDLLTEIETSAANAYPEESCGLLIGHSSIDHRLEITRIKVSPNHTETDKHDSFEIDPQLRFDLMRELEGGPEKIVGHFHSHPNGPAQPSARDLEQVWEPALVWVITSVAKNQPAETAAFAFDESAQQFRALKIHLTE